MKILVVNAGSSSLKYQLIDMDTETVIAKGGCERIGIRGSNLKHKTSKGETVIEKDMPNHKVAIQLVLDALVNPEYGAIRSMDEIDAVGHRVVHSAEDFNKSVLLTDETMKICRRNAELAPLHMPANILGIEACMEAMPGKPMGLVFDTAFHSTMPPYAYMYAIDYNDYKDYKIRKYGFHGTSHKYVSQEAIKYLGKKAEDTKIITCHLGGGSSISAVKGGKCIDTSMGFTPLAGVPMGTRSGDIDPAVLEYLAAKKHYTILDCINYLNKQCGVAGISGVSSDFRDLTKAADEGNERAKLALEVFVYNVKKYIGSYIAALDGLDCLVFTAGIGENTSVIREAICANMDYFGIKIDKEKNLQKNDGKLHDISAQNSKVKVLVIPTNEELVIARETKELLKG